MIAFSHILSEKETELVKGRRNSAGTDLRDALKSTRHIVIVQAISIAIRATIVTKLFPIQQNTLSIFSFFHSISFYVWFNLLIFDDMLGIYISIDNDGAIHKREECEKKGSKQVNNRNLGESVWNV